MTGSSGWPTPSRASSCSQRARRGRLVRPDQRGEPARVACRSTTSRSTSCTPSWPTTWWSTTAPRHSAKRSSTSCIGKGISREGSLLDVGVDLGFVKKSGAWYTYDGEQLGQGRENAKAFLVENPEIMVEVSERIRQKVKGVDPAAARRRRRQPTGWRPSRPCPRRPTGGRLHSTERAAGVAPGTGEVRRRHRTRVRPDRVGILQRIYKDKPGAAAAPAARPSPRNPPFPCRRGRACWTPPLACWEPCRNSHRCRRTVLHTGRRQDGGHVVEVLKVSSKSNPNSVAGALAGVLRQAGAVEVQVVGAGALNQAIKAIAIARGFVAPVEPRPGVHPDLRRHPDRRPGPHGHPPGGRGPDPPQARGRRRGRRPGPDHRARRQRSDGHRLDRGDHRQAVAPVTPVTRPAGTAVTTGTANGLASEAEVSATAGADHQIPAGSEPALT